MLYTVGHTRMYNKGIKEQGKQFRKIGKERGYTGGIAFKSHNEAIKYLSKIKNKRKFSVYGLRTTLGNTYTRKNERYIRRSSRIVPVKRIK